MVPSGRVIVTGLAAVVPEGGSSRLLRAVRRLIGTVALQAVIAACRWRRHGLDFTAWLTSEATQDPGKVEICPVRTMDALAPVSGSRQLACGVARARQETNSDISLLCRGPAPGGTRFLRAPWFRLSRRFVPRWRSDCLCLGRLWPRVAGPRAGPDGAKERGCGGNLGEPWALGRVPPWFPPAL